MVLPYVAVDDELLRGLLEAAGFVRGAVTAASALHLEGYPTYQAFLDGQNAETRRNYRLAEREVTRAGLQVREVPLAEHVDRIVDLEARTGERNGAAPNRPQLRAARAYLAAVLPGAIRVAVAGRSAAEVLACTVQMYGRHGCCTLGYGSDYDVTGTSVAYTTWCSGSPSSRASGPACPVTASGSRRSLRSSAEAPGSPNVSCGCGHPMSDSGSRSPGSSASSTSAPPATWLPTSADSPHSASHPTHDHRETDMPLAPRAMVISLQKTGTHLMQGLMTNLGYKMAGVPRRPPQHPGLHRRAATSDRRAHPVEVRLRRTAGAGGHGGVPAPHPGGLVRPGLALATPTGPARVNRYGQTRFDFADSVITNPHLPYSRFADTPAGLCWIFHELDISKVDGSFFAEWVETATPPLVYNYRDPRDALVSMVNFLEGRTREGYGNFYEFDIFHRILASLPTWEDKLDYAMRDTSFLGRDQFERGLWLLRHPDVCKVSYEDLVGERGGGSRQRQLEAVDRLLKHVGSTADAEEVAGKVYDQSSWSFFRGTTGTWRERFTKRNEARFAELFGDILEQYGYE